MNVSSVSKTISAGNVDMNRKLALEILWSYLNDASRFRRAFKRDAMVNGFSADFFASEQRLVIQVAGEDEFDLLKILMGSFSEMMLRRLGYKVRLVSSEDILLRCESVLMEIYEAMYDLQETRSY